MELIDKAAVLAEIEKLKAYLQIPNAHLEAIQVCDNVISVINTLEVKEVDLEKEIELVKGDYEQVDVAWNNDFDYIAKHFFELGLKTKKGE